MENAARFYLVARFLIAVFAFQLAAQTPAADSSLTSQSGELLLNKADSLIRQGQLTAAENAAREYIQQHAQSAAGYYMLGHILFLEKKAKESLAQYTEGAKYSVPSARDLTIVASDYVLLNDFADADKWFTKVTEWTPHDTLAWYNLARTKYNENLFEEAIQTFKKVLQLDPSNVKAFDNLGLCYQALERTDEAAAAYKRAMELEPSEPARNSGPYLDYGSLLVENNNMSGALPLLDKALEISPDDFRVHRELGKAYMHLNDFEKARAELQKAIELAPRNAPLHFMLAQVYRKQGLQDRAKQETDTYSELKRAQ